MKIWLTRYWKQHTNRSLLHPVPVSFIIRFLFTRQQIELKVIGNQQKGALKSDDSIELKITGRPKSYVALTSYDKSLLHHARNHDISREDILTMFEERDPDPYTNRFAVRAFSFLIVCRHKANQFYNFHSPFVVSL